MQWRAIEQWQVEQQLGRLAPGAEGFTEHRRQGHRRRQAVLPGMALEGLALGRRQPMVTAPHLTIVALGLDGQARGAGQLVQALQPIVTSLLMKGTLHGAGVFTAQVGQVAGEAVVQRGQGLLAIQLHQVTEQGTQAQGIGGEHVEVQVQARPVGQQGQLDIQYLTLFNGQLAVG